MDALMSSLTSLSLASCDWFKASVPGERYVSDALIDSRHCSQLLYSLSGFLKRSDQFKNTDSCQGYCGYKITLATRSDQFKHTASRLGYCGFKITPAGEW